MGYNHLMNSKDYWIIAITTLMIFAGTYALLSILGFVPEEFKIGDKKAQIIKEQQKEDYNILGDSQEEILIPDQITISKIGVNSIIQKPQSQDVAVLDEALTKGAVYYPGSGTINVGNIFLFGHSTGFSVVNNQAYKTFNDLNKLVKGDKITIRSGERTFIYKVDNVKLLDDSAAFVDFEKTDRMLTISTCNTFGQKQERWVVEAYFEEEI